MEDTEARSDIVVRVHPRISDIGQASWNSRACTTEQEIKAGRPDNPFLDYRFLHALEESKSATAEKGWMPQHLALEYPELGIMAVMPNYAKGHSQGEYVFDHGWADAFERAGGRYYPKLLSAIPFTPATGPRILAGAEPGAPDRHRALVGGLMGLCDQMKLSSAHVNFLPETHADLYENAGFLIRHDTQFHWNNHEYKGFEEFLETLASRKRKQIRKERRAALENGITIKWFTGADLTEGLWDTFFEFYIDTGSRKWGRPYLTRAFFSLVGASMPERTLLIMAEREGRLIAGALNFIGADTLYGRHWGCIEDHPNLHFEVCYYQAIDFAIRHGLKHVEAGAQGGHKLARGYVPKITTSAHYIPNPSFRDAVAHYLEEERLHVAQDVDYLSERTPFKKTLNLPSG